jgi:pimeloyl-ACP methyl ester carboxylesterase
MTHIPPQDQDIRSRISVSYLYRVDTDTIAYRAISAQIDPFAQKPYPTIVWLGGFRSDMGSAKIDTVARHCENIGLGFICFDYYAHGETKGDWSQASIGRWKANALDVVDHLTNGPIIVIGSSMGGWMATFILKFRRERVISAGFIAPAPDFITRLLEPSMSPEDRHALQQSGVYNMPSFDGFVEMSQEMLNEARRHTVLETPIDFEGPVIILHGQKDDVVPWTHGLLLFDTISSPNMIFTLIKDGDHRLSRTQDLERLLNMVIDLSHAR